MAAVTFGAGINGGLGAITTNAATYTTPSFTPAANDLLVAVCGVTGQTASDWAVTDSLGGSWTKVRRQVKASSADILEIWIRDSLAAASSMTVTYSHASGTSSGGMLLVLRVSGMTKTGNSGAALTQGGQDNQASGTPAPVLSATPQSTNPIISAMANATNPCGVTVRTGYTSHNNAGYGTPTTGFRVTSDDSGETSATLTWGSSSSAFCSIAVELDAGGGAFTLDAQPGSYALTGAAATLARGLFLDAQPGTYVLTGAAATLTRGFFVLAAPGAYAVTGVAAGLLKTSLVSADPGAYALNGAAASLAAGRVVNAAPGAYTLTGVDANLVYGALAGAFTLDAQPGTYTLSGAAASLIAGRALNAAPAAYTLTGAAASLPATRIIQALAGAYTITGADAGLVFAGVPPTVVPGQAAIVAAETGAVAVTDAPGASTGITDAAGAAAGIADASGSSAATTALTAADVTVVDVPG